LFAMKYAVLIICLVSVGLLSPSVSYSTYFSADGLLRRGSHTLSAKTTLKMSEEVDSSDISGQISRKQALLTTGSIFAAGCGSVSRAEEEGASLADEAVPAPVKSSKTAKDFSVPYAGKDVEVSKFLGKATLVVNIKIDDPGSLQQMPALVQMTQQYGKKGLRILAFPSDQGYFEPDESEIIRIKNYQVYGFGQYPIAVLFDKIDIVGNTIHPFYQYLCSSLQNPYGLKRITLNYEKFLLDADGRPVRRYPRKTLATEIYKDIEALLADKPLPAETKEYQNSWVLAKREAVQSQYAFKKGLNYYDN